MKAKRIVFKVGTSSLTNPDGTLSRQKVKVITQQLALLHESGHELILVSSGAVAAGFGALGFKKRPTKVADKQASAAVGQGLLMEEYTANLLLRNIVSAQILLTQDDFALSERNSGERRESLDQSWSFNCACLGLCLGRAIWRRCPKPS